MDKARKEYLFSISQAEWIPWSLLGFASAI
jgi:hypothetical protein